MTVRRSWPQDLAICFLTLLGALRAAACADQDSGPVVDGLSASIHTPLVMPRANAPFPLFVTVNWRGRMLREGSLEVRVNDGNRPVCRWQSDVLTLNTGERTSAVLLPPLAIDVAHDAVEISVAWLAGSSRVQLATRSLAMGGLQEHLLTLALCLPVTTVDPKQGLLQALALENYAPAQNIGFPSGMTVEQIAQLVSQRRSSGLRTLAARLRVEELPEAALAWCAYDAVAIAGDGLASLKARQVQALEQWLRAGGACCLLPDGPLAPAVTDLLTRAAQDNGQAQLDRRCTTADDSPGAHARLRLGLGRLVVTPWKSGVDHRDDPEWRESAAFLWRVRRDHVQDLVRMPTWSEERFSQTAADGSSDNRKPSFSARPLDLRSALTDVLWPERVAMIPFSLILLIFLVFILAVGPGDWFLLGWLRARRFTWLLFPLMAIGCTWFTVWIARRYMGATDQLQHLEIIDVAKDGASLRRNHLDLLFTGSSKTVTAHQQDALWAVLGSSQPDQYSNTRYRRTQADQETESATPLYTGNLPGRYQVEQSVAQWTPVLRRELSLATTTLPWPLPTTLITQPEEVANATAAWRSAAGPNSVVLVIRDGRISESIGNTVTLQRQGKRPDEEGLYRHRGDRSAEWLIPLCSHPTRGWFALSSTMAPAGGATYDDLAVCDPSDPQQFLVVFADRRGDTLWVVRCLYRQGEAPPATGSSP